MNSQEENNWRLLRNPNKGKYNFLIGVFNWSIELQEHEFNSLYNLLNKLITEMFLIQNQLMEEELINLEIENLPWYVELEGSKNNWSLRIIFESFENTRSFEMYWPPQIAEQLFHEMRKMWESMQ